MKFGINKASPLVMHIDLNSCFATVEQQANPLLRGKPVAVAAYDSPGGIILSPSIEAKRCGVKTGMPVREGRELCPGLVVRTPDSDKYRDVHRKFVKIFQTYSPEMVPKSIDEAVIDFGEVEALFQRGIKNKELRIMKKSHVGASFMGAQRGQVVVRVKGNHKGLPLQNCYHFRIGSTVHDLGMEDFWLVQIAKEIKLRMKREIGEWIWCNIGLGPNRFLAKTAAGLHKPDGLDVITHENLLLVYRQLTLVDLYGINVRYEARLNRWGIFTPLQLLEASERTLRKQAFKSIVGHYWYLRLRGWEIDRVEFGRKTYGHQYALGKKTDDERELLRIIFKLTERMGRRLRRAGKAATGVHVSFQYTDYTGWNRGRTLAYRLSSTRDLYREIRKLFTEQPERKVVRLVAVRCYGLVEAVEGRQMELFANYESGVVNCERKDERFDTWGELGEAMDKINDRYGEFVVYPALMLGMADKAPDRIGFGRIDELEETDN